MKALVGPLLESLPVDCKLDIVTTYPNRYQSFNIAAEEEVWVRDCQPFASGCRNTEATFWASPSFCQVRARRQKVFLVGNMIWL